MREGQLLADLRTTYQQSRRLVDRAKRCRDWPFLADYTQRAKAETSAGPQGLSEHQMGRRYAGRPGRPTTYSRYFSLDPRV